MRVVPDKHLVEVQVSQSTVESLWFLAQAWECSIDDALDRCVEEGLAVELES
jgi:hypothetical protein